ncbi:MAG: CoA-binding protein [Bacteroidales bacterium]|nr:CoA-binding protein [Bacteroidales bacterium]
MEKLSLASIDEFRKHKTIAIVGISDKKNKFSNTLYKELLKKGYTLYPVNPRIKTFDNRECFPDLKSIPEKIKAAIIITNPSVTETIVKDAVSKNIKNLWIQQGAESETAVRLAKENNINVITKHCFMMFAEPLATPHKIHRFFLKLFGKYPK